MPVRPLPRARLPPVPAGVPTLVDGQDKLVETLGITSLSKSQVSVMARYTFTKAVSAVGGIDGVRLHDLRHTCASLAISEGANVKVVQKLLGHKSAVLTLDKYGHLFPDDLDAVADAFDTAADALRTVGVYKPVVVGTNTL